MASEVSFTSVMTSLDMGGDDALDHLQQRDLEEDLALCHAQHLTGLLLADGHALNAALVDDGEIAGIVDDEGNDTGRHAPVGKVAPQVEIEPFTGSVEDDDKLEHQRRAADDPDDHVEKPAYRLAPATQGKGDEKSQRQREQQRQEKQLQQLPHACQQGKSDSPKHEKSSFVVTCAGEE